MKQSSITEHPKENIAIIGNSAQTMHPVAGQGLNTGVRDALVLSDCIKNDNNLETKLMLNEFNLLRKKETKNILRFTDSLVMLFSNNFVGINKLRGMALSILDLAPPIKKKFVRKMSYGK